VNQPLSTFCLSNLFQLEQLFQLVKLCQVIYLFHWGIKDTLERWV